nr:retrotransposon Orf1 [Tanacetum cinerariifolium]
MPELVENTPKVVCEPKVWTRAPIIEAYESDSNNDSVSNVQEDKEKPSFSFTDSVKHAGAKESKVSETITSVSKVKTINSKTSNDKVEMPKIETIRMSKPIIEEWESDSEDTKIVVKPKDVTKTVKPSFKKIEFVNARNKTVRQAKNPRKNNKSPRGKKRNWNGMMTQKLGENFEFNNKACYVYGRFDHLHYTCKHKRKINDQKQVKPVSNNSKRVNHQNFGRFSHPNPKGKEKCLMELIVEVTRILFLKLIL